MTEPLSKSALFKPSVTYKPFDYEWAVELTIEHERMHWHEGELGLGEDINDWRNGQMSEAEKNFVTQILRMFTQSDVNVGTFYTDYLIPIVQNNQVRGMLRSFCNREDTHQRAYALVNDSLGLPDSEWHAFMSYKEMEEKSEFMLDADPNTLQGFALALAKAVFNEGVTLFGSFAMLLNFVRFGKMPGMCKVVEWSVKDETKHVEGVAKLFRTVVSEHPRLVNDRFKKKIYDMARTIVKLEDHFIDLAFEMGGIRGLTPDEVKTFIRFITDRRLVQLGLKENFSIESNPLPWFDEIVSGNVRTNFFEADAAEYETATLVGEWSYSEAEYRIYGRKNCPYCDNAKKLMEERGVKYEYVDLSDNDTRQKWYDERGFIEEKDRRVPKIYYLGPEGEDLVGGFTDLARKWGV